MVDGTWWIPWVPAVVAIIAGVLALTQNWRNNRARRAEHREPSWVELDNSNRALRREMDEIRKDQESLREQFEKDKIQHRSEVLRYFEAFKNILETISDAWPTGHPIPDFDPRDINVFEDTMPPLMVREILNGRGRRKPRASRAAN